MSIKMSLGSLETLATSAGFASYKDMLHELYVVQHLSMVEVAARCHLHCRRVRKHLMRFGIAIRPKGRRETTIEITPELIIEVTHDGIPAAASRLGVDSATLYNALQRALRASNS